MGKEGECQVGPPSGGSTETLEDRGSRKWRQVQKVPPELARTCWGNHTAFKSGLGNSLDGLMHEQRMKVLNAHDISPDATLRDGIFSSASCHGFRSGAWCPILLEHRSLSMHGHQMKQHYPRWALRCGWVICRKKSPPLLDAKLGKNVVAACCCNQSFLSDLTAYHVTRLELDLCLADPTATSWI
jgi:hypothetical protein